MSRDLPGYLLTCSCMAPSASRRTRIPTDLLLCGPFCLETCQDTWYSFLLFNQSKERVKIENLKSHLRWKYESLKLIPIICSWSQRPVWSHAAGNEERFESWLKRCSLLLGSLLWKRTFHSLWARVGPSSWGWWLLCSTDRSPSAQPTSKERPHQRWEFIKERFQGKRRKKTP